MQAGFAAHVRNPAEMPAPSGIETRRMKVYNDLIYNNIEGFLSGGFPVLRSLYRDEDWHQLVRAFVRDHRCETPYFLEISQEFLRFLMEGYTPRPLDPPFLAELAHYEWVELVLDVADDSIQDPGDTDPENPLEGVPELSPLAWSLQYRYPVHQIGPGYEPDEPPQQPTFLVVYRNRDDEVNFIEANAATARLLELIRANSEGLSARELLEQLAGEMNEGSVTSIVDYGATMLRQFIALDVICRCPRPA
jgi:hypothetical protein